MFLYNLALLLAVLSLRKTRFAMHVNLSRMIRLAKMWISSRKHLSMTKSLAILATSLIPSKLLLGVLFRQWRSGGGILGIDSWGSCRCLLFVSGPTSTCTH